MLSHYFFAGLSRLMIPFRLEPPHACRKVNKIIKLSLHSNTGRSVSSVIRQVDQQLSETALRGCIIAQN